MTRLAILLLLVLTCSCNSSFHVIEKPTNYSTVIENRKFKRVIFLKDGNCLSCLKNKKRFSPTLNDIEKAEKILEGKIEAQNSPLVNQGFECPIIHRNLNNYRRQYFGYIEENGDKIIYITLNWDRLKDHHKGESESWKKEKEMVLDGCSYYWEIKTNLTGEFLFDLSINGSS